MQAKKREKLWSYERLELSIHKAINLALESWWGVGLICYGKARHTYKACLLSRNANYGKRRTLIVITIIVRAEYTSLLRPSIRHLSYKVNVFVHRWISNSRREVVRCGRIHLFFACPFSHNILRHISQKNMDMLYSADALKLSWILEP